MKALILTAGLFIATLTLFSQTSGDYPYQGVSFNQVKLSDAFWLPRIEINRTVTIPASFQKCEETDRIANLEIASGHKKGKFMTVFPFDDTDLYKTIEGASFSMAVHPDPELDRYVDSLILIIAGAQEEDGYLYTARTIDPQHPHEWAGSERWVNESILSHELYNSGHLFEAAAAHYMATGKKNLLDIALKNADLLCRVFGPGRRSDAPGHEIVEMGLVRLYRITGEVRYLDLAKFFIDCRGKEGNPEKAYSQDHIPVIRQVEAVGHAILAGYLYSGVADVAALTGNSEYLDAIDRIWENMVSKKFYITGGIGAARDGERFGANYELPNLIAYNETCAAIANVYWNYRMFLLHGEAKYIDVLERSLYNNVISGVGSDGKSFFYPNPLACNPAFAFNMGSAGRQPWFDCSCCPTNVCRFIPSVPGYIYAHRQNNLYINLFIGSSTTVTIPERIAVTLSQQSQYPWDGNIRISVDPSKKVNFVLNLRIPGWAKDQPVPGDLYSYLNPSPEKIAITINGKQAAYAVKNGYAVIDRQWKKGDKIEYTIPMPVRRVIANPEVAADRDKVALERGPLVFCLEGIDNKNLNSMLLPDNIGLSTGFYPDRLGGVQVITGEVPVFSIDNERLSIVQGKQQLMAIPYFAWNNRGISKMEVWIPRKIVNLDFSNEK